MFRPETCAGQTLIATVAKTLQSDDDDVQRETIYLLKVNKVYRKSEMLCGIADCKL